MIGGVSSGRFKADLPLIPGRGPVPARKGFEESFSTVREAAGCIGGALLRCPLAEVMVNNGMETDFGSAVLFCVASER